MCNIVYYGTQILYGSMNGRICSLCGRKIVMVTGMLLHTIGFILFLFVSNKKAFLGIMVPIGIANIVFMAIPYAACLELKEDTGTYIAFLIMLATIGQQLSNFAIGKTIEKWGNNSARKKICWSSIASFISMILSFMVENVDETAIKDSFHDTTSLSKE